MYAPAFDFELIGALSIDAGSLRSVMRSDYRAEWVFQPVQQIIVEDIGTVVLSTPPPTLSRAFHEIANGTVEFHEALWNVNHDEGEASQGFE